MPRVQGATIPQLQLGPTSLPGQDTRVGAGVFKATQGAAGDIAKQARTMIDQYDTSRSREGFNDFREMARQKTGELKNLRGRDAIGASKAYETWFEKESQLVSGGLDNSIQQNQYKVWADQRRNQDLNAIAGHEAVEGERYNLSVHAGELAHSQGDIMASYGDEERIEGVVDAEGNRVGGVIQDIKESFDRTYPGINKDKEIQAAVANARSLRIQLMAEDNPTMAAKNLEKHKVSLGPVYLQLKGQVATASVRKESQVQTDMIRSQHIGDYKKQLKVARAIGDSKVRDATVKRINERKAEDQRLEQENQQVNNDASVRELQDGRDAGMSREQLYDMAAESLGGEGDADARTKAEKLVDSWFKTEPVDWDAVVDAQNAIDAAALQGVPLTNEFLTLNYGGIVGRKLPALLSRNTTATKHLSKAAFTQANENLRNMFKSKAFGDPKKSRAKARYAGIDTELNQFMDANPQGDPLEWLDARMKVNDKENLVKSLEGWSPFSTTPFEEFEELSDSDLALELLSDRGVDDPSESLIKKVLANTEFQQFKLDRLAVIEGQQ